MDIKELNLEPEIMDKLKRRGYKTVESLATASIQELMSRKYGITIPKAREIRKKARESLDIGFRNAGEL